jgi:hypothetical protein
VDSRGRGSPRLLRRARDRLQPSLPATNWTVFYGSRNAVMAPHPRRSRDSPFHEGPVTSAVHLAGVSTSALRIAPAKAVAGFSSLPGRQSRSRPAAKRWLLSSAQSASAICASLARRCIKAGRWLCLTPATRARAHPRRARVGTSQVPRRQLGWWSQLAMRVVSA